MSRMRKAPTHRAIHPLIFQLRLLRQAQKITTLHISGVAGYHPHTFYKVENGHNACSLAFASDYAESIGYELVLKPKAKP